MPIRVRSTISQMVIIAIVSSKVIVIKKRISLRYFSHIIREIKDLIFSLYGDFMATANDDILSLYPR